MILTVCVYISDNAPLSLSLVNKMAIYTINVILYPLMLIFPYILFSDSTNIGLVCSTSNQLRSGYPYPIIGSDQDYGVNTIPSYITGLSCPANNYYADGSCQFTLNSESCAGYGGTSIITCIDGKPIYFIGHQLCTCTYINFVHCLL